VPCVRPTDMSSGGIFTFSPSPCCLPTGNRQLVFVLIADSRCHLVLFLIDLRPLTISGIFHWSPVAQVADPFESAIIRSLGSRGEQVSSTESVSSLEVVGPVSSRDSGFRIVLGYVTCLSVYCMCYTCDVTYV